MAQNPKYKQILLDSSTSSGNYQLRYVSPPHGSQMSHHHPPSHNQPLSNEQYISRIPYNPQNQQNHLMNNMHGHPGLSNVHGRSIMQRHGYNNWGQNVLPIHNLFPTVSTNYYSTPNPSGGYIIPINHETNSMRGSQYQYYPSTPQQYVPGAGGTVSNVILGSSRKDWLDHTTKAYSSYKPYTPQSETVQLLYPPGTKVGGAPQATEKDETKDESVIKDEVRDKKSTKRHEHAKEKYDDNVNEDRKRDINDDDEEEYDEDEEEDDEEEEKEGDSKNDDEEDEDEEYEEEESDASENDKEEDATPKNKLKDTSFSTPFYTDKHSLSKIKIPDPHEISESPFFSRHHSGRTGKTVNFGKHYSGSGDSDFITTEKSLSYENAPMKLTTKITPLTFTKKYQPANFSFGVNYKPKQRYKSTYVPTSPKNHYSTEDKKSEYEGSAEKVTPYYSGYSDYSYKDPQHTTDTYPKYADHSHYSDERNYTPRKTSYPSYQGADYRSPKNSSYSNEDVYAPEITTSNYHQYSGKSHELVGPQNERPSNHKYEDSFEETTPYYNAEVTTPTYESEEDITIPNSMKIPHANELTTTEKPLAIKIHYHHHDEKVYEDDNAPSSTPQIFYHDYANDYDNYTEYADYSDYTGQPAADYDNITQTSLSSTEDKSPNKSKKYHSSVGSEQPKEESGENDFKGQDFYNDYYETPSTTTKRHIYDSKTSTTNKERLYTSSPTTANPIQLDSYQNVILNLKNSKPPRDDSIYFNTTSYIYNFNKYDTTATPVQKHKKRIVGHLKKVTKSTTPTTPKVKLYTKLKASNEIDYDTYPTSSSKQKAIYTDPQQDNSLISNKVRKKQELVRLSKPRIKLRNKSPTSPRVRIYPPLTKTKTSTDRDLSESKLHQTVDKLNLVSK